MRCAHACWAANRLLGAELGQSGWLWRLAAHRLGAQLAFAELDHGLRELGHEHVGAGPVEVAAARGGAGVARACACQFFEVGASADFAQNGAGLGLGLDQNVAHAELLALVGGGEFGVFGLHLGVGDRVFALEVGEQFADEQGLRGQLHLGAELGAGTQTAALGFLGKNFAHDGLFAQLGAHGVVHGAAAAFGLLHQRIQARRGHGFAVDDGQVLRISGQGEGGGQGHGGEQKFHGLRGRIEEVRR